MNSIKQKTDQESQVQNQPIEKKQSQINYNGFTNLPPCTQIMPVIFFFYSIIQIIIISIQNQWQIGILIIFIIYAVFSFIQVILWFVVTKINPTDSIHILHKKYKEQGKSFDSSLYKFYCNLCETYVSKYSFHCKKCRRCVQMFDHHCKWLNNCIGAKNYLQFIGLISISQISMIFHLTLNILGVISNGPYIWVFYFQIFTILVDFIILIFVSILLGMHIYLIINKKTTLSLIMQRRKNNKIHPNNVQHRIIVLKNNNQFGQSQEQSQKGLKRQLNIVGLKVQDEKQHSKEFQTNSTLIRKSFQENQTSEISMKKKKKFRLAPIKQ